MISGGCSSGVVDPELAGGSLVDVRRLQARLQADPIIVFSALFVMLEDMKPPEFPNLDKTPTKKEGLPVITYTQFQEMLDTDTGRDTFIDFEGFIDNQDGQPPEFVSVYINHAEYGELGAELKNFLIMLRSGNNQGKNVRNPEELNNFSLRFMPNRAFSRTLEPDTEKLVADNEQKEEGMIAFEKKEMGIGKPVSSRSRDLIARLLVVCRFSDDLTSQEKIAARELVKRLTEQFLREVVDRTIQDQEELVSFSETFFSNEAVVDEMKRMKINEVTYSLHSKLL